MRDKPIIITIAGKARHGKDTFARLLKEKLDGDVQILRFADGVKELAYNKGWNGKKDNNGRAFLQFIGTEYGREQIDKNIWVKKAENKIRSVDYVIIPDCRFPNEATYFGQNGYTQLNIKVVRIDSEGNEYENELNAEQKQHDSETALNDFEFDYVFRCSNLECLKKNANLISLENFKNNG